MIKIIVTEDHPLMREGLKNVLEAHQDILVLATCGSGAGLLELLLVQQPDVLLLDLHLSGGLQGVALIDMLKKDYPEVRILVLTSNDNAYNIQQMLHAGASGYILKNVEQDRLIEAITCVYQGEDYLSPEVKDILLQLYRKNGNKTADTAMFTSREIEILQLIAEEYSSPEIAKKLNLSNRTIDTYRLGIMQKLGVKNMVGMAKKAILMGLVKN